MLDIKFIRENADLVREATRKKRLDFKVEELLATDEKRLELLAQVETWRAEQNKFGAEVAKQKGPILMARLKELKNQLKTGEEELRKVMTTWQKLMLQVPNIPDVSVPEGESEADNREIKTWGEKPKFKFEPKSHVELMPKLDLTDFEAGAKVAGFRGYFLKNDGAELSFAIWQYAKNFWLKRGFQFMIGPSLVRRQVLLGTGFLPQGEADLYQTQDGDYLAGTGEVAAMGYFADSIINQARLPIKVLIFSPCFRREAGAHGKDVRGLVRVHEFFKLEQVVLCEADHGASVKLHEEINTNIEEFIQSLEIPYRIVVNCGADLGLGQVKKYDIELWVPGEKKYREIGSASYFHDFQTRRLNIRYRDATAKLRFAHSLNSTAIPTPRILVSLVENYQQADRTVKVPSVLVKYLGHAIIGSAR